MIAEQVKHKAVDYRGVLHLPVNVCAHCGYEDDPESAASWETDDDGDRMCPPCAEIESQNLDRLNKQTAQAKVNHAFYRHEFGECCSWPADIHTA